MRCNSRLVPSFLSLILCLLISTPAWSANDGPVAIMSGGGGGISWSPLVTYDRLVLTVSQPDGSVLRQEFSTGIAPSISAPVVDGQYTYELTVIPVLSPEARIALTASRESGDMTEVNALREAGILPIEGLVQSGYFRINGGAFVQPSAAVE